MTQDVNIRELAEHISTPQDLETAMFIMDRSLKGMEYMEKPVYIDEFVLSDKYLNLKDLIRPAVLQDLKELFCDENSFAYCPYEEAVFDEAIGTGKSYKTSIIISYYTYNLLCLVNPLLSFNLDPASTVTVMNMSVNGMQAKKVVFGEVKSRILNSPWFAKDRKPDPTILSELRWEKGVNIIPANSATTFPLGYNLIVGIMDESAFYTETEVHDVAEDIFYTLKRRIQSRFNRHGLLIMISSPRYIDDFIERKAKEGEDDPLIFVRRHKIWEVLPEDIKAIEDGDTFESRGEQIPNKYKRDFDKNPEKAWRDLGGIPSLALEPYFKDWTSVEKCLIENTPVVNEQGEKTINIYHPFNDDGRLKASFKGFSGRKYYMHVDLGLVHDACGIAMGHYEQGLSVIDMMHRIKPKKGEEVDIQGVIDLVKEIRERGFHITSITYDQFQSASSIQQLKKLGFSAGKQSVEGLDAYETMKEEIYQGLVRYYKYEPFIEEMRRLELIKGKKVDHPPSGCFSGDTRVALLDGTNPTFEQLVEEKANNKFYVYTIDNGIIRAGLAYNPRMTKISEIIEIELDNFQVLCCTEDHLFMRLNGEYIQAKYLEAKTSLMPFYRSVECKGGWNNYERIYQPILRKRQLTHQMVAEQFKIDGEVLHHIDGNKRNNIPLNIIGLEKSIHSRNHTIHRHKEDIFYSQKVKQGLLEYVKSDRGRAISRETITKNMPKLIANRTSRQVNHRVLSIKKTGKVVPVYDLSVERTNNFALSNGIFVHNSKDIADAVAGVIYAIVVKEKGFRTVGLSIV